MTATGTILLTLADPTVPHDFPNHVFESRILFDPDLCFTSDPFVIHPNEGHVLITDLNQIRGADLQDGSVLTVDERQPPLQLCYVVRLKSSDMMMYVGRGTSLSLLLRSGCLLVTPFVATQEQVTQLIRLPTPPPPPPVPAADEQVQRPKWIPARPPTPCPPSDDDDDDDDDDDM
jgi:hypothetical protein